MQCGSIFKNEILTFQTTWMKLKDIMLSEINQMQREKWGWGAERWLSG